MIGKLVNGKIKPKYGTRAIIGAIILVLLFTGFFLAFIYGLINFNLEFIIMPSTGMFGFGYLLLISPYTQMSSNYYIEFQSENSLAGFKLSYKGKLIDIKYKIDNKSKIAFADNNNKLSCISYADETKMPNFTKYRIMNYFGRWLNDNNLLSSETTKTLEKI